MRKPGAKTTVVPHHVFEFVHGPFDFMFCHGGQIPVFREVLPNEFVGVLVQATLPGGIRMREIDTGLKVTDHAFMIGELAAIITGDSMYPVSVRREAKSDGFTDSLGCLASHCPNNRIQRFAFNQRHQGAPMTLADHGVALPVTEALPGIDNGQTFIGRDLVVDDPAPVIGAVALAPVLSDSLAAPGSAKVPG